MEIQALAFNFERQSLAVLMPIQILLMAVMILAGINCLLRGKIFPVIACFILLIFSLIMFILGEIGIMSWMMCLSALNVVLAGFSWPPKGWNDANRRNFTPRGYVMGASVNLPFPPANPGC
jgi:hypothetical protein